MEDPAEENLDGSSIKPVSSLRSHFEQMANLHPNNGTGIKSLSPQPTGSSMRDFGRPIRQEAEYFPPSTRSDRGRDVEISEFGLQPPRRSTSNVSPSPTRNLRVRPISTLPPAVTVQPPQSPPKPKALNINLTRSPSLLSTNCPLSATSGTASPRHFRIPSRPNTPLLDPRKSPSLPASQPPSPPPPRRSGEFRREAAKVPPPVNRAEKPKIASKPMSLALRNEATTLEPHPIRRSPRTSPFSTPPDSDSSPEQEHPNPVQPHKSWQKVETNQPLQQTFQPPPRHHSVISRRKDQETNGLGRGIMSPQVTGEQRPALPIRPQVGVDASKMRSLQTMMPPPPPRISAERSRPVVLASESVEPVTVPPPKRVFSQPTSSQLLQTPPRSHGRSMTVDRTSDRAPTEFRMNGGPSARMETRPSFEAPPSSLKEVTPQNLGEYPDISHSNRRPPCFKTGAYEIATKYDTRILDVCGDYVCTSGNLTRIWNIRDGELIASLAHTEGIKIISVAFKPGENVNEEGQRIWLGNNVGEIMEIDVQTASVVSTKSNAHTRRDIIKIYRHLTEMWTMDDGGTLHLWAADDSGTTSLTNPIQSFRVPKGHTFSMVVGDELWYATGKDIRVFVPTPDGSDQFQVLARPLNQSIAGDISSGTTIDTQPDKVYFGHIDGKISIYSRADYAYLGVVNISTYRITTLAGVGGNLWVGLSSGEIYVYDTTKSPWIVKKDWLAHDGPVMKMIADRSSCWTLDRSQVVSLGNDSMIRIWDGLLNDDWIENQMQSQEADFSQSDTIRALVLTWNAGASTPYHLQHSEPDASFFKNLIQSSDCPDILVFGFQELVDLEDKKHTAKTTAKSLFTKKKKDPSVQEHMSHQYRDWRDFLTRCLDDYMPGGELYQLLHSSNLVGLFTCIFVKASIRERIHSVAAADVKRGPLGYGSKGALIIRFVLDDSSLCFVNCHLAAGQSETKDRNKDMKAILESSVLPVERDSSVRQDSYIGGGDGSMIMDHELCIINGDLNYRIDTMGRDTVVSAVKSKNFTKLLERDQLLASKRKNPWFKLRAFNELPINFAPTYKYDVGTDNYDTSEKKRAPAWCDRVLYRGRDRIKQLEYKRHEVRVSDHRPVTGSFQMVVKRIEPGKRAKKWEECQKRLLERKERLGREINHDYLVNIIGYDDATSKQLIQQYKKAR